MKYTEKELEYIIRAYKNNVPPMEIAKKLNRTKRAIINKAYKLGCTKPKNYTEYEKKYILENYKSYNLKDIAKHLGREKTNIVRWVKQQGLERTKRKKENPKTYRTPDGISRPVGWRRKTPEEIANKRSKIMKEWHKTHEHPKGMLGKTHSLKYRKKLSKRVVQYWENISDDQLKIRTIRSRETRIKNGTLKPKYAGYSRGKAFKRKDLNQYFRSTWEANIARFFNYIGVEWEYEPKRFIFDKEDTRPISYLPDFYLPEEDRYVEVKGWFDKKSKIRMARFDKYFKEESLKLYLIDEKEYNNIKRYYSKKIDNWES